MKRAASFGRAPVLHDVEGAAPPPVLDADIEFAVGYSEPAAGSDAANMQLKADKVESYEQALIEIYRVMRPGEPPTRETAEALFQGLFFDPERYDLSAVGRVKMNMRLDLDAPDTMRVLRREDIEHADYKPETLRERGVTTDCWRGIRWMHTFRKLPITAPKRKVIMSGTRPIILEG